MLNKIFLEQDGLVVGGNQLTTQGGSVSVGNNIYVGANTVTSNLTVTGTFNYPKANTLLPAFRAYGSGLVTSSVSTNTPIRFDLVEFDTNNCFNPTNQWLYVNGIYTPAFSWAPNIAGYYIINSNILFSAGTGGGQYGQLSIYKQNNQVATTFIPQQTATGSVLAPAISTVLYMNGVSDYISIYGWQNYASTLSIGSNGTQYSFNGCFLRPA